MARILIAGCGDIGIQLGKALVKQGHKVFGLRRNIQALPTEIEGFSADLCQASQLEYLPSRLDFIFYLATPDDRNEADYHNTYVTGLQHLLQRLDIQQQTLQRLFFISSTSVYGQDQGEWVDENSPTIPARATAQQILRAEQLLAESEQPYSIVRFSGIYGPGRFQLISQAAQGLCYPSEPIIYTNRIHRDDCVRVLQHLMVHPEPDTLYVASDCSPCPLHEVSLWISDQLDSAGYQLPEPKHQTNLRQRQSRRCNNERLLDSGFEFLYPNYQIGYRPIILQWLATRVMQTR